MTERSAAEWAGEGGWQRVTRESRRREEKPMRPRRSCLSEKPIRQQSRRLVDWLNLAGAKKVH